MPADQSVPPAVTLLSYTGRCGDRNGLATAATADVAAALASALGVAPVPIPAAPDPGYPQESSAHRPSTHWSPELDSAAADLTLLGHQVQRVAGHGGMPISVLPRCVAGLASVPAALAHHSDAVIVWFDAHADLHTPQTTASGYLGGMALAGALGLWDSGCGAAPEHGAVLVGARAIEPAEQALIQDGRVSAVPVGAGLAERLVAAVAGRPVYVHIDLDVLEPGLLPVEYETPAGLSFAELRQALAALTGSAELVGFELAELQTRPDGSSAALGPLLEALSPVLDAAEQHRLLYHCSLPGSFNPGAAVQLSSSRGLTLDEVGFIHLSTWAQLEGTVERFYADVAADLHLLVIDPDRLPAGALRFEAAEGQWFPHLYAGLPTASVIEVKHYLR